ncbi:hypothetical protein KA005_51200 [bacterium]|nr:hypothetical protein [bacterium]
MRKITTDYMDDMEELLISKNRRVIIREKSPVKFIIIKRIITCAFVIGFVSVMILLLYGIYDSSILSIGAELPVIEYETEDRIQVLKADSTKNTVIILFSTQCDHCLHFLEELNYSIYLFSNTRFYIFSSERKIFDRQVFTTWHNLTDANNTVIGFVDISEKFGEKVTPVTYIFNKSNHLVEKIRGEVKIDLIIHILIDL